MFDSALAEERGADDQYGRQSQDDTGEVKIDQLIAFGFVHGWVLLNDCRLLIILLTRPDHFLLLTIL